MNVLLCGDIGMFIGIELVLYSLLTHNKNVNIYIFTMDLDLKNEEEGAGRLFKGFSEGMYETEKLKKIVRYLDPNSHIKFVDTYDLYMEYLHGGPNTFSGFTPYAALRLIADLALPHVNHILYLDCDTAIQGNLHDMYYMYLNMDYNYFAYYCPDACDYEGEMVSGVMLMKLDKIRKDGFLIKARRNYNSNLYNYPDQCALRDAGKAYPLPETYSFMGNLERCHYKPIILHFTNQLSPKIYQPEYGRNYFYKRYPFLNYVKKGCELLDKLNI